MSIRLNGKIIAGNSKPIYIGFEIGDIGIAPLGIDETKGKRRYLNGQIIIQEQYFQFTNKIKSAVALYPSLACTEAEWQTAATMSALGQCGKFVVDNNAGTIRLPKVVNINGLQDLALIGSIKTESLPNVTGEMQANGNIASSYGNDATGNTGAFYKKSVSTAYGTGYVNESQGKANYAFDASRSSSIYQDNAPVQQEAIQYPYFIQVATGAETEDNIINEYELINPFVLLEPQYFQTQIFNACWLRSLGTFNGSKLIHPNAYNALLIEYNTAVEIGTTVDGYTKRGLSVKLLTETYTEYDFVIDLNNETFMLPTKVGATTSDDTTTDPPVVDPDPSDPFDPDDSFDADDPFDTGVDSGFDDNGFDANTVAEAEVGTNTDQSQVAETSSIDTYATDYLYYYVGDTAQNPNIVNLGRIEENINTILAKVDKELTVIVNDLGSISVSAITLAENSIYRASILSNSEIILPILERNGIYINCMIEFTIVSEATLTLPSNVIFSGGEAPGIIADGTTINRLIFDTTTGGETWFCYFSSNGEG